MRNKNLIKMEKKEEIEIKDKLIAKIISIRYQIVLEDKLAHLIESTLLHNS
jgi:hypothetical protein